VYRLENSSFGIFEFTDLRAESIVEGLRADGDLYIKNIKQRTKIAINFIRMKTFHQKLTFTQDTLKGLVKESLFVFALE
jgi:hypothetical protein